MEKFYLHHIDEEMLHYDLVEGNHRLTKDELEMPLVKAVSYFKNLTQYSNLKENKLNEHFINIFKKDENLLQKYGQKVYDMLKEAYKPIGGLLGCESYEELIKDPDMMWKLKTEAGKILAVFIYSFKKGERKLQYCTCEKSDEGRSSFMQIMEDDKKFLERMFWGEISGAVENYYVTKVGMSMIPNIFVKSLLPDKKDIELDSDGFHYTRNIGGKKERKESNRWGYWQYRKYKI